MTINREAQLLVAKNRLAEAADRARREAERLQAKLAEYESMSDDRRIGLFYPFYEKKSTDVLGCCAGVAIWDASQSAQELANLLQRSVSFEHNERKHTLVPEKA